MRAILVSIAVVALTIAYSWAVHVLVTDDSRTAIGVIFAVLSAGGTLLAMVWSSGWWARGAVVICAAIAAWWGIPRAAQWDPRWVYLLQHAGIHFLLGGFFASTLLAGKTPLITRMARLMRQTMNEQVELYTRKVTTVWAGYFFSMALLSLSLFIYGLISNNMWPWSILSNALTWPAIALLACGEYLYRRKRFPRDQHMTFWENLKMTFKVNPRDF